AVGHPELRTARWLRFHELAYAAFRMGQTTMCASMTNDRAERARLRAAAGRYRGQLAALLDVADLTATF
ncbi:MAG: hypothetical protein JWM12_2770, partial [Ilumatobacteraceae bacterium]|nr:hypothetical protein [Ilumatobacteraceae bacterium]